MISPIGLELEKSKKLANELNLLLANYQVMYMNTRGFHWNIKGQNFFELHLKFEELYTQFQLKIDEIAERVLTLGFRPIHAFAQYLQVAEIAPKTDVTDGITAIEALLEGFQVLIVRQRKILQMAGEFGDEGTNALMSDYIREQEKTVWMLRAYLG